MTDNPAESTDGAWRTLAGQLAVVAVGAWLGRWGAGANFGYILFAAVWGPIASAQLVRPTVSYVAWTATAVTAAISLPLTIGWPLAVALRVASVLFLLTGVTSVSVACGERWLGRTIAIAWVSVGWLTWTLSPVTAGSAGSDPWIAEWDVRILAIHPLPMLNRLDTTAGDWTHQPIAYHWLTRLGQSVPFEWPSSGWLFVSVHGVVIAFGLLAVRLNRVPRGTCRSYLAG